MLLIAQLGGTGTTILAKRNKDSLQSHWMQRIDKQQKELSPIYILFQTGGKKSHWMDGQTTEKLTQTESKKKS